MQSDWTPDRPKRALTRSLFYLNIVALALMLADPARAQTDTERAAARSAAQAGDKAFKAQHYEEAAMYFARAEAIMHAPTLLLFLARSQAKLGQYVKARESYIKVVREQLAVDAPSAYVAAKQSASVELPAVEAQIATLTLQVPDVAIDTLSISIDGEQVSGAIVGVPYPIDPGEHRLTAHADGYHSAEADVSLAAGQSREVSLQLARAAGAPTAAAQSAPVREVAQPRATTRVDSGSEGVSGMAVGGYVGLGLGAAGIGLGTYFAVQYVDTQDAANAAFAECERVSEAQGDEACSDPDLKRKTGDLDDEVAAYGTKAWISYGVGAASLATGIALLALSRRDTSGSDDADAAQVIPYVTPSSLGVVGRF